MEISKYISFNKHIQTITTSASRFLCYLKRNIRSQKPTHKGNGIQDASPAIGGILFPSIVRTPKPTLIKLIWCSVELLGGHYIIIHPMQVSQRCFSPLAEDLSIRKDPNPDYVSFTRSFMVFPASILRKSTSGRHRPVSYPDGPMTARYRFT